jgi:hypothetical protein
VGLCEKKKKVFGAQSREDAKASGWQEVQRLKQFLCGSASLREYKRKKNSSQSREAAKEGSLSACLR